MVADRNLNNNCETKKNVSQGTWKYMKLSSYVLAIRPWSLSTSFMPTLLGYALAYKLNQQTEHSLLILSLTLLTVLSVHCVGNLVCTYFDYVKINHRKSDDRTSLINHKLSKDELVNLSGVVYTIGFIGCVCLATLSPAKFKHLALVYFGGLSSSFLYTGRIRLKCIALGSAHFPIVFVPVSVLFAYLCQSGKLEWGAIYHAIPLALNAEATLRISNNNRDLKSDKKVNSVAIAHTLSHIFYTLLLFTPYIICIVLTVRNLYWFLLPWLTAPTAFQIEKKFRNSETVQSAPHSSVKFNFCFGLLYVLAVSLTDFRSSTLHHLTGKIT